MVKNLTDYGAFVDLGGIDGLLHITDIAWRRVKHPSEVLKIGDEIEAKILHYDRERNRVSLGLKQLGDDPWVDITRRYPEGTRLFGKVTNITDYGAFVEIEPGVEGLVHVSEMDWTNKNSHPSKVVQVGDETEVMVLDIDTERRRISLGMKQCQPNPWEEFSANHQKNEKLSGKIKSITDFGVFVGLGAASTASSTCPIFPGSVRARRRCVTTRRATISRRSSSRSIRNVSASRSASSSSMAIRSRPMWRRTARAPSSRGKVTAVEAKGATVSLAPEVEGYLRASEAGRERVEDARSVLKEGDEVEAKITTIDRKNRKISLSIRAKDMQEETEAVQEYTRKATGTTSALGDKLKEKLGGQENAE